ncbi:MAG: hypothetical protein LBS96_03565 [Oscillospiraceae bacterium]|nr:hypothetical protein [Oscillospiraceae bacterium]
MAAVFTDPLRFQDPAQQDDAARLLALLGGDPALLALLQARLHNLQRACFTAEALPAWAMAFFPLGEDCAALLRLERQPGGVWNNDLRVADMAAYRQQGLELPLESTFGNQSMFAKWACIDERFLKAFRSAALLVCLDDSSRFLCRVEQTHRPLAEAVLADIFCNALPQQHRRFVTAVAGTGRLAAEGFRYTITAGGEAPLPQDSENFRGAAVDFLPEPPLLDLRFPHLSFAQRTVRSLLGRLDLPFLVSMWNAAERVVVETIGAAEAAQAQDIVTWQMLRKNFSNRRFPITEAEHTQLQRRVREFHQREGN